MNPHSYKTLIIFFFCIISGCINLYAETSAPVEDLEKSEEYQIGIMVKSIQKALDNPEKSESLEVIIKYGSDSRYYNMIRGWLMLELSGVVSQYEAIKDKSMQKKQKLKIEFLKKAIRAIDLE